jgi:hypothetical protein
MRVHGNEEGSSKEDCYTGIPVCATCSGPGSGKDPELVPSEPSQCLTVKRRSQWLKPSLRWHSIWMPVKLSRRRRTRAFNDSPRHCEHSPTTQKRPGERRFACSRWSRFQAPESTKRSYRKRTRQHFCHGSRGLERSDTGERELAQLRWDLIPFFRSRSQT